MTPRFRLFLSLISSCVVSLTAVAQSKAPAPGERPLLPLHFEQNQGQAGPSFRAVGHAGAVAMYFEDKGFAVRSSHSTATQFRFVGANDSIPQPELETSAKSNYLLGSDRAKWVTGVTQFERLRYRDLYPGIDLLFYGDQNRFEHDFIVAPGADYRAIQLRIDGLAHARIDASGDLVIGSGAGAVRVQKPVTYQIDGKRKLTRTSRFVLVANTISFEVADLDPSKTLYIDPVFVYSTYLGSDQGDHFNTITVNAAGEAYVTGLTWSSNFPATASAFQKTCASCPDNPDIFVVKLNATGTQMLYATYIGGAGYDWPRGIAVDSSGVVGVTGTTESLDFPSVNPMFEAGTGYPYERGFILSLSADGSSLNFSSRTPPQSPAFGVDFDSNHNLYFVGTTSNAAFPTTAGTLPVSSPPAYPLNYIYAVKLGSAGTISYSALIQPTPTNAGFFPGIVGARADADGNLVIAGQVGAGLPTTSGAYQRVYAAGYGYDAFALKLNPQASALVFATYLGSDSDDRAVAFALAPDGSVVLVGTPSTGFPTTGGDTYKFAGGDCCGAYVAKLAGDGSSLLRSTIIALSNSTYTYPQSVTVDSTGKIYVTGTTSAQSLPLVKPIASQNLASSLGGGGGFLVGFDPDMTQLQFSTYFTGDNDGGVPVALATDSANRLFVGGFAGRNLFTTAGVVKPTVPPPPQFTSPVWSFVAALDLSVPSPVACFSNGPVSFFLTPVGTTDKQQLTVSNCGEADLTISSVTMEGSTTFSQVNNCTLGAIAPHSSCVIEVRFAPTSQLQQTGRLLIDSNAPIHPSVVNLSGTGTQGILEFWPDQILPTLVGQTAEETRFFLVNMGYAPLHITDVTMAPTTEFTMRHDCDPSRPLMPINGNRVDVCSVYITFAPTSAGLKSGSLTVQSDSQDAPHTFTFDATGITEYPVPAISFSSAAFVRAGTPTQVSLGGTGFFPTSQVLIDGVPHASTFASANGIMLNLDATEVATMGEKQLTIFNPGPGGGTSNTVYITVFESMKVSAADIDFEPYSRRLIATSPTGGLVSPESVLAIDPVTRKVENAIALSSQATPHPDPHPLALTRDGRFAYVGVDALHGVRRVDLFKKAADQLVTFSNDVMLNLPVTAGTLRASPVDPGTFVAVLYRTASPSESAIVSVKDGVQKSRFDNAFPTYYSVDTAVFSGDGAHLYAADNYTFYRFDVTNGVLSQPATTPFTSQKFHSFTTDGTLIFSGSGDAFAPSDPNTVLGTMGVGTITPDRTTRRAYSNPTFGSAVLAAYDTSSFQQLASLATSPLGIGRAIRWGRDGFAFNIFDRYGSRTADEVILFRSPHLVHTGVVGSTPTITGLSATEKSAHSANFDLTITGAGFVPGALVHWNSTDLTTEFVDATHLIAKIGPAELGRPGSVAVQVINFAGSPSNSVSFKVRAATKGPDFNGDGKAEPAVWRPSNGTWYAKPDSGPALSRQWGAILSGVADIPVPGDYDGDGITDFAVWRPGNGTWYVIRSSNPSGAPIQQQWGAIIGGVQDIPVPADYDGDGITDFAVWRPGNGTWYIIPSSNPSGPPIQQQWGAVIGGVQDIPVPGDYDGDGNADFAVWRPGNGTWYVISSSNPSGPPIQQQWGAVIAGAQDVPVPADYDGDGKADFAVWRPGNGTWYIIPSSNPSGPPIQQQWGTILAGVADLPMPADFDGDGKADIAVWRPSEGNWFIRPSTSPGTYTMTQWGLSTDKPVPNVPYPH